MKKLVLAWAIPACLCACSSGQVESNGLVHTGKVDLPPSIYMSDEAREAFSKQTFNPPGLKTGMIIPYLTGNIAKMRAVMDQYFYTPMLAKARLRYSVTVSEETIGGIRTDVIIPKGGIAPRNSNRVLINLHGGAFTLGAGMGGLVESIPIAATTQIKVISVDYREGPEYQFPAASEDVAAVYRELLKKYPAANVGIYGCSAGGVLTAQSVAWFQTHNLPRPGAIGMLCAPASIVAGGDLAFWGPAATGQGAPSPSPNPPTLPIAYLKDVDPKNPLASPMESASVLKDFPPTVLITGTRSFDMSSVVETHRRMVLAGVDAELRIWDGLWHGFIYDVDLPESREAYAVLATFFDRHLGAGPDRKN